MISGPNTRKIIFFGNERLVSGLDHTDTPILKALIASDYEVVAVVANDAGTKSRKKKVLEVAELAEANNIPVHMPHRPIDIIDELKAYDADVAVLIAYGRIIPQELIDLFPFGIINVHPSLLPKYRGPSPIESAIANGDKSTGISIMSLSAKMDAGPMYSQFEHILEGNETAPQLSRTLSHLAAYEFMTVLPKIFSGSLKALPQDESNATYCRLISKQDAWLKPNEQTSEQAERLVRAYLTFPKARLNVAGHSIIVLQAHISTKRSSLLTIKFKDYILSVDELIAPSGKKMNANAFISGYLK